MKHVIVVSDGFNSVLFEKLKNHPTFDVHEKAKLTQDELSVLLPKVNGLVIRSATKPDKELVDKAPNLKYIIRAGEGTDNIDKAYCQERGVRVSNTPGANGNSAAEHAIALMFTIMRKTAMADSSMKNKKWDKALFNGDEITGKTIGFIGFGRIGQTVAKRLSGFEPKIFFYDPSIKQDVISGARKVDSLETLMSECDIITIHSPLVESTKNMVNLKMLSMMRPSSYLINAARGGIVDEHALYEILKSRKIAGAALDVFATEPLEETSKLSELDNIVLTPHIGASTSEAQFRVGEMVVQQLIEYFDNENLLNEVRV